MNKRNMLFLAAVVMVVFAQVALAAPSIDDLTTRTDNVFRTVVKLFMQLALGASVILGILSAKFLFVDHEQRQSRGKGMRYLGGAIFLAAVGLVLMMTVTQEIAGNQYSDQVEQYIENTRDW